MAAARANLLNAEMTAALDWWREAGVDRRFEDVPHQWLAAGTGADVVAAADVPAARDRFPAVTAPPPTVVTPPPRDRAGGDPADWPRTLAEFAPWWLSAPSLDLGRVSGRVPPRGNAGAPLMVLVAHPEAEDAAGLLAGPQGRLLNAMLAAMAIAADDVYIASVLPRHTPMADWADLAAHGYGDVLRHHVALVRPQRAIAFGRHVSALMSHTGLEPPRLATSSTQTVLNSSIVSHDGASVPILVARDLGSLLDRPIAKGAFWQDWLEWSATG